MFWGVILEPGKRYSQVVASSFHLSMAALEPPTKEVKNSYVSVMMDHSNTEYLLCTLEHGALMQVALDLLFVEGEEVSFFLNGEGTVHLTGYVISDGDEDEEDSEMSKELASEISVEEDNDAGDWSVKKAKKRKPSQGAEQLISQKKQRKDSTSPTAQKASPAQKSAKVDIVDVPRNTPKSMPSQSPFANKQKNKAEKKVQLNSSKLSNKSEEKKVSDDEWEDEDSDEDDDNDEEEEQQESESGDDDDDDDDASEDENDTEEVKSSFVPKLKKMGSQSAVDSMIITKNKFSDKNNKNTPIPKKDQSGTPNRSFSGKQNHDQKGILTKRDSMGKPNAQGQDSSPKTPKMKLQGGVEVDDMRVGNGPVAKPGKHVHLYYSGKLTNSAGKEFDSVTKGKPFSFKLGKGEVIKGWDVAINGMKVGGKRKITIPPHMAYGTKTQGPIPANSTLYFEVELKAVS